MERKKLNIWTASSFFIFLTYLVFLVYPIVTVLKQALIHEGQFSLANFVTFFSKAYYSETLVNSFKVSITATVTSLVVGTLLAYLFSMYDFKGKKFLQILIIMLPCQLRSWEPTPGFSCWDEMGSLLNS